MSPEHQEYSASSLSSGLFTETQIENVRQQWEERKQTSFKLKDMLAAADPSRERLADAWFYGLMEQAMRVRQVSKALDGSQDGNSRAELDRSLKQAQQNLHRFIYEKGQSMLPPEGAPLAERLAAKEYRQRFVGRVIQAVIEISESALGLRFSFGRNCLNEPPGGASCPPH